MNEIERVVSYIKSCRDAGIDCTITIDKSRTHLIFNALSKSIPNSHDCKTDHDCITCGCCQSDMALENGFNFCPYCGQKL